MDQQRNTAWQPLLESFPQEWNPQSVIAQDSADQRANGKLQYADWVEFGEPNE